MLTGTGAPSAGLGAAGQLYTDTAGHALWLNVAGTWTQLGYLSQSAPTNHSYALNASGGYVLNAAGGKIVTQ